MAGEIVGHAATALDGDSTAFVEYNDEYDEYEYDDDDGCAPLLRLRLNLPAKLLKEAPVTSSVGTNVATANTSRTIMLLVVLP